MRSGPKVTSCSFCQSSKHRFPAANLDFAGILKNSFHRSPPNQAPISTSPPPAQPPTVISEAARPGPPAHTISEKDITIQNTLQNAGPRRRSSSAVRPGGASRRQSSNTPPATADHEPENMRLKWDEANLYLTEQEKSSTMKIDEPKTPYAKRYDPSEDEEELRTLDAQEILVDELDKAKAEGAEGEGSKKPRSYKEDDIPGLELGEPEEAIPEPEITERKTQLANIPGEVHDPESEQAGWSKEEREKHQKFEEMRKKHYEMKNVAEMLAHPVDEDEDEEME